MEILYSYIFVFCKKSGAGWWFLVDKASLREFYFIESDLKVLVTFLGLSPHSLSHIEFAALKGLSPFSVCRLKGIVALQGLSHIGVVDLEGLSHIGVVD